MKTNPTGTRRYRPARRAALRLEALEHRLLLAAPEPNNSFGSAYAPSSPDISKFYMETNYFDSDSVSTTSDTDDYRIFYTLYGPSRLYAVLNGMTSDADLYVYDQNYNLLASSTAGSNTSETINVNLPGNQYIYVRVRAYSGATNYGLYLYNDYSGSTLATARDIGASWGQASETYWAYGKIFNEDYLDYRDNVDIVKFRMEAPGTVSLRMKDFTYTGGLRATMQLLDSGGSVLRTVAGTVGDGLDIQNYALNTGTYYVRFTQTYGSDPYTFRIVSDYAGDRTATARDLYDLTNSSRQLYDMVSAFGGNTYDDALDLYKFTFSKAAPLDVRMSILPGLNPPTFDADLFLARDTNNDGFIQNAEILNTSANSGDDELHYSSLPAGTYYLGVRQNGAYTSYQLDIDSDLDAVPGSPAPYSNMARANPLGTIVGETYFHGGFGISAGDFNDFYKFTLAAPATIEAYAVRNSVLSRSLYDPYVSIIRDTNGNQRWDSGEELVSAEDSVTTTLPAGTYYLAISGSGGQAAYYGRLVADYAGDTLGSSRVMKPIDRYAPTTQTFKDYIEQDFGAGSDVLDFYRFDLPDSMKVVLKTTGVSGEDLALALLRDANNNGVVDPGDVVVESDALNSPNESITRNLAAGRYFARVRGLNGATNYVLTAQFSGVDPDDQIAEAAVLAANALTLDGFRDGVLTVRDDVDLYRLDVAAGQRVGFDLDARSGSNLDTSLRLFASDGTTLAWNNDGAAPGEANAKFSYLEYVFTTAGTYFVGVALNPNSGYDAVTGVGDTLGANPTGAYRLAAVNLGTASPTIRRVNAGGGAYIDAGGRYFDADSGFSGGTATASVYDVAGTAEDGLLAPFRSGGSFNYNLNVANGTYTVTLEFADALSTAAGQNVFNVLAEGATVLSSLDVFQAAGASRKAISRTFTVSVADGRMNLAFRRVVGQAMVSAISLVRI